ncbi:hypothetical protein Droror1_Dr00015702 [Drosera rotundifolia]
MRGAHDPLGLLFHVISAPSLLITNNLSTKKSNALRCGTHQIAASWISDLLTIISTLRLHFLENYVVGLIQICERNSSESKFWLRRGSASLYCFARILTLLKESSSERHAIWIDLENLAIVLLYTNIV